MRVEKIKKIIDAGDLDRAAIELDSLLAIGPSNIEALKLKAGLSAVQGHFVAEREIWLKINQLDEHDLDSLRFLQRQQLEDREYLYFTDELPTGRRFLAYPKSMAIASLVGLGGCVMFFVITQLAKTYSLLASNSVVLATFTLCVISPWILIIYRYLTSIVSIAVTNDRLKISSRLRTIVYRWEDLARICLAHHLDFGQLSLVLLPKNSDLPVVRIDLSHGTSSICAKSYLIAEIAKMFANLERTSYQNLKITDRQLVTY